jgi:hypothetical protein
MSRLPRGLHTVQGQITEELLRIQFAARRSQLKDIVTHVSWNGGAIAGTGDEDWRNRKVEIAVTP